jgi:hypothetical protein
MQNEKAYTANSALQHVAPVAPASSWPPDWLKKAREIAHTNQLPPPKPDIPELAAWDDIIIQECGATCPKCGSLEKWWDLCGNVHCQQCEPLHRAYALADLAARLRRRRK